MKKILSIWLLISFFSLSGGALDKIKVASREVINTAGKGSYTCLLCGFDNAACNTDTLIIASYNAVDNVISFVHIPRDSYFNFGKGQNKINQIVPSSINNGGSIADGLEMLTEAVSGSFAVEIDGYTAFKERAVINLIDLIGGVNVNVPCEIVGKDVDGNKVFLEPGYRLLSGRESLVLLRHRSSYPLGDLSRIDVQKIFLSAFVNDFFASMNPTLALKLLTKKDDGVYTSVNLVELLSFAVKNLGRIKDASVKFATLPGEAIVSDNGLSYFAVNKNATAKLLAEIGFIKTGAFDPDTRLLLSDSKFKEIYYSENIKYKIFTRDDLKSLRITTN